MGQMTLLKRGMQRRMRMGFATCIWSGRICHPKVNPFIRIA